MVEKKIEKKVEKKVEKKMEKPVEKKSSTKTSTKRKNVSHAKKTVVKTVPVKIKRNEKHESKVVHCGSKNGTCCTMGEKILSLLIMLLVLVNIVLSVMLVMQRSEYNKEKLNQIGGIENYNAFKELTEMKTFKDLRTESINGNIEQILE